MFLFRFPEKISNFFYIVYGFLLLASLVFLIPLFMTSDLVGSVSIIHSSQWNFFDILNFHFFFLIILKTLLSYFSIANYEVLKILNLIYLFFLIFTSYQIIKLKFYDLEVWGPLSIIIFSGVIIYCSLTIQDHLARGLITLIIFYFYLKIFEEEKIINNILFTFFSILALLMGSFFFLIIIFLFSIFKLINLNLQKEKRLSLISNLSFIFIFAVILLVINQINQQDINFQLNISIDGVLSRLLESTILLLPLIGIFIVSIIFNITKRINWNTDLLSFLFIISGSLVFFIFYPNTNYAPLVFLLPFLSIYIYRTLEFVEIKYLKIIYLSLFFIPFFIIYLDTTLYSEISDIPIINFIFYLLIVFLSLINPFFIFEKQKIVSAHKVIIFSIMSIMTVSSVFFYHQYHHQLLHRTVPLALLDDFQCDIETTKISSKDNLHAISSHFYENMYSDINELCHVELSFTSLTDLPINDINSVNKTILSINQKLFLNLNIKKL